MALETEDPDPEPSTAAQSASPAPYVHEPAAVEAVARAIDTAYAEAVRWWDVDGGFRNAAVAAGLDPEEPIVREVSYALLYVLRPSLVGESAGCVLRPASGEGPVAFPPETSQVAVPVVDLWSAIAGQAKEPDAVARFSDLLFERQRAVGGGARASAVAAADTYMTVAETRPLDFDATMALMRAWEIARAVGDTAREARARELMIKLATAGLANEPSPPGVVLPLINALTTPPRVVTSRKARKAANQAPAGLPAPDPRINPLLEQAFASYPYGHLASEVAMYMRRQNTDDVGREAINRREVQARIDEASSRPGLVRMRILEEAVNLANRHNIKDLAERATALMQAISQSELGLVTMTTDVKIDTVYAVHIEHWLRPFTQYPDWREGFVYFLRTDCPTGHLDTIKSRSAALAAVAVFRSLIPTTRLNADGLPHWTPATEEQRRADQMAEYAHVYAAQRGQHLAQGLLRIKERYGTPEEADLLAMLSVDGQADRVLAASLARAFRHFWNGDYEACVHIAVPKIEAAARALLRAADEGIYRTQAASTAGGYPGLYVLVDKLKDLGLDESWAYFLQWLLASPTGMNLRNEVAHGFIGDIGPIYAALVLRAATFLSIMVAPLPVNTVRIRERGRVEVRHAPTQVRRVRARTCCGCSVIRSPSWCPTRRAQGWWAGQRAWGRR